MFVLELLDLFDFFHAIYSTQTNLARNFDAARAIALAVATTKMTAILITPKGVGAALDRSSKIVFDTAQA